MKKPADLQSMVIETDNTDDMEAKIAKAIKRGFTAVSVTATNHNGHVYLVALLVRGAK